MGNQKLAASLQQQAYAILAEQGQHLADLATKHPIGMFVRLAKEGVTKIEDVSSDITNLTVLNEDGQLYQANSGCAWKIEESQ